MNTLGSSLGRNDPLTGGMYSIEDVYVSLAPEEVSMLNEGYYWQSKLIIEDAKDSQNGRVVRLN